MEASEERAAGHHLLYAHDGRLETSYFKNLHRIFKYLSKIMLYSRRIVITLLLAACFQLVMGNDNFKQNFEGATRRLSKIRTITTIDGCESTNYGIWLYAGSGHISLIGEPIVVKKKEHAPGSNGDQEDPKNGHSSNNNTASCATLVFDDGGEKLDKVMIDISIVNLEDSSSSSSNVEQNTASTSNEDHAALWKEDAMRLHQTNYKNANKTTSSFVLSEVIAAYHRAMHRFGDYDIFNNNCATFVLNMMAQLGIKVDNSIIKFAASELYKNHTVIATVLQNQTFMEDLFLEFSNDGATTTSSHKATATGLLRSNNHHQAQAAAEMAADSLQGTEMFVAHYVKEWRAKHH